MAMNPIQPSFLRGNGPVESAVSPKTTPPSGGGQQDAPITEVDQVRLTPETVRLRQHIDASEKQPPMNEAKIKALREAISAGTYQVNSEQLASKIFDFERALA